MITALVWHCRGKRTWRSRHHICGLLKEVLCSDKDLRWHSHKMKLSPRVGFFYHAGYQCMLEPLHLKKDKYKDVRIIQLLLFSQPLSVTFVGNLFESMTTKWNRLMQYKLLSKSDMRLSKDFILTEHYYIALSYRLYCTCFTHLHRVMQQLYRSSNACIQVFTFDVVLFSTNVTRHWKAHTHICSYCTLVRCRNLLKVIEDIYHIQSK